ncbi:MAG: methyltransferase [Candidatus Bathyarchaeota archaeon]|nr:methyltransferase [Candidatus Bathyarchaeota archaeon]
MTQKTPPIITSDTAKSMLEGKTSVSIDLGLSKTMIKQTKTEYHLNEVESIDKESLEKIAQDERSIYFVQKNIVYMAAIGGKHFYKLAKTPGAPTLEIDGIRMHRTKDTTPEKDTEDKIQALGLHSGRVLDTCMGLGYTAVQAHQNGAEYVVSIEYEPNVIRIAQLNPWSRKLFTEENIYKLIGDSFYVVDTFPSDHFDYIIHDPPRHSSAGHLYGQEFYDKLARVLKPRGRMFHYTGEPRSRYRKVNIQKGITERLALAGFTDIQYHHSVMGVTCTLGTV